MIQDRVATSDWIIGAAVRFEYGDNGKIIIFIYLIKIKSKYF